jgi:hypothetical protein
MSQHSSSQKGWFGSFSYSPLNDWASRTISRLKSLVGNGYKRKRMTISLKNVTIILNRYNNCF